MGSGLRDANPMKGNQVEKNIEHEVEMGIYRGLIGIRA